MRAMLSVKLRALEELPFVRIVLIDTGDAIFHRIVSLSLPSNRVA